MTDSEQLTLPLEYAVYDHYTIELRKDGGTQRTMTAKTTDDALNLVDAFRETCLQRDNVTWQGDEPNMYGRLFGLAPGGVVFEISVVPPLSEALGG